MGLLGKKEKNPHISPFKKGGMKRGI